MDIIFNIKRKTKCFEKNPLTSIKYIVFLIINNNFLLKKWILYCQNVLI